MTVPSTVKSRNFDAVTFELPENGRKSSRPGLSGEDVSLFMHRFATVGIWLTSLFTSIRMMVTCWSRAASVLRTDRSFLSTTPSFHGRSLTKGHVAARKFEIQVSAKLAAMVSEMLCLTVSMGAVGSVFVTLIRIELRHLEAVFKPQRTVTWGSPVPLACRDQQLLPFGGANVAGYEMLKCVPQRSPHRFGSIELEYAGGTGATWYASLPKQSFLLALPMLVFGSERCIGAHDCEHSPDRNSQAGPTDLSSSRFRRARNSSQRTQISGYEVRI